MTVHERAFKYRDGITKAAISQVGRQSGGIKDGHAKALGGRFGVNLLPPRAAVFGPTCCRGDARTL
jgi:hypothetical protein